MDTGVRVFCSYSRSDEAFRNQLETHLAFLRRQGVISQCHFREIAPEQDRDGEIHEGVERARLFLMLVSRDLLASNYCYDLELARVLQRREAGEAELVLVILRPVDLRDSLLRELQVLPDNARPVSLWDNADEAWISVARGIRLVCENLGHVSLDPDIPVEEDLITDERELRGLDFAAEYEMAMAIAVGLHEEFVRYTEATSQAINGYSGELDHNNTKGGRGTSRLASDLISLMQDELDRFSRRVVRLAVDIGSEWDRVDSLFPLVVRGATEGGEEMVGAAQLRSALVEGRPSVAQLARTVEEAGSVVARVGEASTGLKFDVEATQSAVTSLRDAYWRIDASLARMTSQLDGVMTQEG